MPANVHLQFSSILNGMGYRLSFSNRMSLEGGGEWEFNAEAVYLCPDAAVCRGHWYDNRGAILPLRTVIDQQDLLVEWGDASSEIGRTRYALGGEQLTMTDEVMDADGNFRRFGQVTAKRLAEGGYVRLAAHGCHLKAFLGRLVARAHRGHSCWCLPS